MLEEAGERQAFWDMQAALLLHQVSAASQSSCSFLSTSLDGTWGPQPYSALSELVAVGSHHVLLSAALQAL
jgi:hypothetical protein